MTRVRILILLFALCWPVQALAADAELYVSPAGNDRWTGRLAEPRADGGDGPFATLARAVVVARQGGAKTIRLRAGTYRLTETLRLGPQDQDLRIAAYQGERPVLSGGEPVTGFREEIPGLFSVPLAREPGLDVSVDGTRLEASRSGDYDPADPIRSGWFVAQGYKADSRGDDAKKAGDKRRLRVAPGQLRPEWAGPGVRAQALDRERLSDDILGVASIDRQGTVTFDRDGQYAFRDGSTIRLLGHPDFLRHPGQFAWRAGDKRLLVRPADAGAASSALRRDGATVARLSPLIAIEGARWIAIEGIGFADVPYDGTAILLSGVRDVAVRGNSFVRVGTAVTLEASGDSEVRGNRMAHLGRVGVEVRPGSNDNRIVANTISDIGEVRFFGGGVMMAGVERTLVAHNDIRHAARYGISLKNWNNATRNLDNVIEYNRIRDTARQTADAGAIETLGRSDLDTRTIIRFNDIRDTGGIATDAAGAWLERYKGFGIYLDDLTNGVTVEGNFLENTGWAAVFLHGGDGNRVIDNIAVLTGPTDRFLRLEWVPKAGVAGFMRDNAATRNIVHQRMPVDRIVTSLTGGDLAMTDTIVDQETGRPATESGSGDGKRRGGRTVQGPAAVASRNFLDPSRDNFRLRPDSPARRMGLVDLPWDRIGPEGAR